jgi:hypothetical protein
MRLRDLLIKNDSVELMSSTLIRPVMTSRSEWTDFWNGLGEGLEATVAAQLATIKENGQQIASLYKEVAELQVQLAEAEAAAAIPDLLERNNI